MSKRIPGEGVAWGSVTPSPGIRPPEPPTILACGHVEAGDGCYTIGCENANTATINAWFRGLAPNG